MKNERLRALAECAIFVALAFALDLVGKFFPSWPNGGSITVAMVPVVYAAYRHGVKWGLATGLVFSAIQMMMGFWAPPVTKFYFYLLEILLDYVLAFTLLGTAPLFARPLFRFSRLLGYGVGAVCVCVIRFLCSFISGVIIWSESYYAGVGYTMADAFTDGGAWAFSLTYNGGYMLPNAILTGALIVLLCIAVDPKTLRRMKKEEKSA